MEPLLILVGPTASGKTAVACEIAKKIPVEMISCDSMQVYRGMSLLTQAPTAREKKLLRAHLVECLPPSKEYNAALFRRDATKAIRSIQKKGRLPMIVGGTGLYVRALLDGLFESEEDKGQDEALRRRLLKDQETHGGTYLYQRLQKVDPHSASKIHPNDLRRLVRALEVFHVTGQPISSLKPNREGLRSKMDCKTFFLDRDRQELYVRIEKRVDQMVKKGLLREVKRLAEGEHSGAPLQRIGKTASMALGFREMQMVLDKKCTMAEAVELLKKNTRHYAKRQLSWFRHEKGVEVVPVAPGETAKTTASKIMKLWGNA